MKLSVILPCFNGAETIAVQLEALTHQSWTGEWEVIVVNNGSTDDSMQIVERYRDLLPGLQIVDAYIPPAPRLGVPHSYNAGIKAMTGDAFVFCESDDEVAPGWLSAMGTALVQHDFVVCRLEYRKLNEAWRLDGFGDGLQTQGITPIHYPPHLPVASGCTFGIRRSVYDAIGELHVSFPINHDVEYCWRAQYAGIQISFVPDAVMHYRLRHKFLDMYRQGVSNGRDFTRVRKYYNCPIGKLDPLRKLLEIMRDFPKGLWLFLQMIVQIPHSRGKFGVWFWHFGYAIGTIQGLFQQPPPPLQLIPAHPLSATTK